MPDLIDLPEWLIPEKHHIGPPYFKAHLEKVLDLMLEGSTVVEILRDNPQWFTLSDFMKIIHADPTLRDRFYEYQEMRIEAWTEQAKLASEGKNWDGTPALEDVPRSALRVNTIFRLAEAHSNKRYGRKQTIDVNNRVDMVEVMKQANERIERLNDERRALTVTAERVTDADEQDPTD